MLLRVSVDGAHELPLRRERDLSDAWQARLERFIRETGLACGDEQCALGRVALHDPAAVALLHGCVVRPVSDGQCSLKLVAERPIDGAAALPRYFALGRVARSTERHTPAGGDDGAHGHLVLRQRAGLVGGDDARRAERLDGGQVADDRVSPSHALHADRQHGGDDGRQSLGDGGDGEGHAENQDMNDRRQPAHILDENQCRDHDDGDDHDDNAEHLACTVELALERRRLVAGFLQQTGDVTDLGIHAGRGHDRLPSTIGRRRAAEDHVAAVTE